VFEAAGRDALADRGGRPALLVIDGNDAFPGEHPLPILESIRKGRRSRGEDARTAIPVLQAPSGACRDEGVPVIYTTGTRRADRWNGAAWLWK